MFMAQLSRYIICGSQKWNFVRYGGECCFIGKPSYTRADFNGAQKEGETYFGYKRNLNLEKVKTTAEPFSEDYSDLEEGYLPYFVTLDILFKQIEDLLQYI